MISTEVALAFPAELISLGGGWEGGCQQLRLGQGWKGGGNEAAFSSIFQKKALVYFSLEKELALMKVNKLYRPAPYLPQPPTFVRILRFKQSGAEEGLSQTEAAAALKKAAAPRKQPPCALLLSTKERQLETGTTSIHTSGTAEAP